MIRSNALFVVIVIALIVGILTSMIVLVSFNHRLYIQRNLLKQKLELNAVSGVNLLLSEAGFPSDGNAKAIDLYGEGNDSVLLKKMKWGLFDIGVSTSFSRSLANTKVFMIGNRPRGTTKSAVYLADDGSSLVVSGRTNIKGTCYLPDRGVTSATISGQFFSGSKYVDGAIRKSSPKLPEMDVAPIEDIIDLMAMSSNTENHFVTVYDDDQPRIHRSFMDTTLLIYKTGPLVIEGKDYQGNILLISDTLVVIEGNSVLQDVIIVSPDIIVKAGYTGSMQAFATDTLAIEENCRLSYPSVLGIIKEDHDKDQPAITVAREATVSGFIFSHQRVEDLRRTLIKVEAGSKIHGYIYTDGDLEMKGELSGGAMCKRFLLNTPSAVYVNHLLNATIDNTALSEHYLMPPLLETSNENNVAKWLY